MNNMGIISFFKNIFRKKPKTTITTKEGFETHDFVPIQKQPFKQPEERKQQVKKQETDFKPLHKPTVSPERKDYKINKNKTTHSYEKRMDNTQSNGYSFIHTVDSLAMPSNSEHYMDNYHVLLDNKVKDKQLFDDLILYKDQLLKKRINMKISLEGKMQGEKGIFNIIGILPEGEESVRQFFTNRTIDSNSWNPTLNEFKNYMNSIGSPVLEVNSIFAPMTRMTVLNIYGQVTFK